MSVIDPDEYVRHYTQRFLEGRPLESLADWAAAQKVVDLAAARARKRLRPAERKDRG
jgi:hypothetical protein